MFFFPTLLLFLLPSIRCQVYKFYADSSNGIDEGNNCQDIHYPCKTLTRVIDQYQTAYNEIHVYFLSDEKVYPLYQPLVHPINYFFKVLAYNDTLSPTIELRERNRTLDGSSSDDFDDLVFGSSYSDFMEPPDEVSWLENVRINSSEPVHLTWKFKKFLRFQVVNNVILENLFFEFYPDESNIVNKLLLDAERLYRVQVRGLDMTATSIRQENVMCGGIGYREMRQIRECLFERTYFCVRDINEHPWFGQNFDDLLVIQNSSFVDSVFVVEPIITSLDETNNGGDRVQIRFTVPVSWVMNDTVFRNSDVTVYYKRAFKPYSKEMALWVWDNCLFEDNVLNITHASARWIISDSVFRRNRKKNGAVVEILFPNLEMDLGNYNMEYYLTPVLDLSILNSVFEYNVGPVIVYDYEEYVDTIYDEYYSPLYPGMYVTISNTKIEHNRMYPDRVSSSSYGTHALMCHDIEIEYGLDIYQTLEWDSSTMENVYVDYLYFTISDGTIIRNNSCVSDDPGDDVCVDLSFSNHPCYYSNVGFCNDAVISSDTIIECPSFNTFDTRANSDGITLMKSLVFSFMGVFLLILVLTLCFIICGNIVFCMLKYRIPEIQDAKLDEEDMSEYITRREKILDSIESEVEKRKLLEKEKNEKKENEDEEDEPTSQEELEMEDFKDFKDFKEEEMEDFKDFKEG